MQKAPLFLIAIFSLVLSSCTKPYLRGKTILFYGDTCPHCLELEKTLEEKQVAQQFSFERKEVYQDKTNAALLGEAAKSCGLPTDQIGVPFLYAEEKCFTGVPEIEKYISEKTGINFEASQSAKEASDSAVNN